MKRFLALVLALLMLVGVFSSCTQEPSHDHTGDRGEQNSQGDDSGDSGASCSHAGGTATCNDHAVCTACGEAYGDFNANNHANEAVWTKNETVHKKTYTCCDTIAVAEEPHEWVNGVCLKCEYACIHTDANNDHACDACNGNVGDHTDIANDGDHDCDYCREPLTSCVDADRNHGCDECGASVGVHEDATGDGDHLCEYCGENVNGCIDGNTDHDCDECGANVGVHADTVGDGDHVCDYCREPLTRCVDADRNHGCDECGVLVGRHTDAAGDGDHVCDHCGETLTVCADTDRDHDCDECGANVGIHADLANDGDHLCEYCNESATACTDVNQDHTCDECEGNVGVHADTVGDGDHLCDYCRETLTACADANRDHSCDECGVSFGSHTDAAGDGDHVCDHCGETLTVCEDEDEDHDCDDCGAEMGDHTDAVGDGDHLCDYCRKTLTVCTDANTDHDCDECGENVGIHSDRANDGDHLCEYCGENASDCVDVGKDHECDECEEPVGVHEDSAGDGDHLCDYCREPLTACTDADTDHSCDECGESFGSHTDTAGDGDHVCDHCGETLTGCEDEDTDHHCDDCNANVGSHSDAVGDGDHLCEYCGENASDCVDIGKDHVCDECEGTVGDHDDSTGDGDHLCDYCRATLTSCTDPGTDHVCDECGEPVGAHSDAEGDGDHLCEYCGENASDCVDVGKDHECDECEATIGVHADSAGDGDHLCDYCRETLTACTDANRDHDCDECGGDVGSHSDATGDGDHLCDYCKKHLTACTDADRDHDCDECDATTSHAYEDGCCTVCGKEEPPLFTRDGGTVYFGSYPQSEVTNEALKSTLNSRAGKLPTVYTPQKWTSYNYYIGGNVSHTMWYIDVEDGGEKYRGVYFTYYRPYNPSQSSSTAYTYQDDNGYSTRTVYWFKYEPIAWTILSEDTAGGTAMIVCDAVMDSQVYYITNSGTRLLNGETVYPNNYAHSAVRAWLNESFIGTAFDEAQASHILTTTVDNSAASTGTATNSYACEDTHDKIFLLSYKEANGSAVAQGKAATDYAKAQGVHVNTSDGNVWWFLRSPGNSEAGFVRNIEPNGTVSSASLNAGLGVVPALQIRLCNCTDADHDHACDVCGTVITECVDANKDHICEECEEFTRHTYENGYCTLCSVKRPYDRNGNKITFGSYPQSEVTDDALKSTLNSKAGTLPTESNSQAWTSYGYYINSNVSNFMWYIDVEEGGEKYRGVYFSSYRPWYTVAASSESTTYQYENGYFTSTVYWFKYEPISWKIVSEDTFEGTAMILCDMIIDSQEYYLTDSGTRTVGGKTVDPNNYAYSTIRTWLNETFMETAFNELQASLILVTTVDNSVASTGYSANSHACENTEDRIFLISALEAADIAYNLSRKATDYAQAQGTMCVNGYGQWWLRSPYNTNGTNVRNVATNGYVNKTGNVYLTAIGVVPALRIKLCDCADNDKNHICDYCGDKISECADLDSDGTCDVCGTSLSVANDVHEHDYVEGICTVCGLKRDGNTVYFGTYPQSKVTDRDLIRSLTTKAGTLPSSSNSRAWTSYGYYLNGSVSNFMWYIDVSEGGERYRGVYFTSARNLTQTENGYSKSTVYWFKYEPIAWTILSEDTANGTALVICDMIIDAQAYQNVSSSVGNESYNSSNGVPSNTYASNYAYSTIRKWLNETFMNTAFDSLQQKVILTTLVDNSITSTGSISNSYVCEATEDKIFLLSHQDVIYGDYGFSSDASGTDAARMKKSTDYAQSQGAYTSKLTGKTGNGVWWLRSPMEDSSQMVTVVGNNGATSREVITSDKPGVVPVLRLVI
ncbi:MAG: hypothetical protein E7643_00050 [Ruminococcaceae bacterium]|nr:hypothetical protein [Oscillospiraceae bacterium]